MADLSTILECYFRYRYSTTDGQGNIVPYSNAYQFYDTLADGTGSEQNDLLYTARRTITASANDDLDLAGSLTDIFGNTLTLVELTTLIIANLNTTSGNDLKLDSSVANSITSIFSGSITSTIPISASGLLILHNPLAGFAVTAGTADKLRITNTVATSVQYDILIAGRSA